MSAIEAKLIEIRDRMTFIPALATRLVDEGADETYLMRRAGYGGDTMTVLEHLNTGRAEHNPHYWGEVSRTMAAAHLELQEYWDKYQSGSVLDVEFVLGESKMPKQSERLG